MNFLFETKEIKEVWDKVVFYTKAFGEKTDRYFLLPIMKWTVRFFSKQIRKKGEQIYLPLSDWKQNALDDFKAWLHDIPSDYHVSEKASADSCDLYTMLTEFTALRQEIRLQTREQDKSLQTFENFVESYTAASELFRNKTKEISELEERIRLTAERRAVLPFLDMRDALIRGHKAAVEVSKSKKFFRPPPRGIEGIIAGYEMALRRFDSALEIVNIYPVNALGRPFEPKTMKAIGKRRVSGREKGIVIEEQLSGFIRQEEVIRTAEVIVSE